MAESTAGSSFEFQSPAESSEDRVYTVITKRFGKLHTYYFSVSKSLFIFGPEHIARRVAVSITTNQLFHPFIMVVIIINCVFLTFPDEAWVGTAEYVFISIYTIELILRVIARGFVINKHSYLRDTWHWVDFTIVVTGLLTIFIERGLKTLRVLRAVRSVSLVTGLKTIVRSILRACRMLLEVLLLIVFCLVTFALFALQMYMGVFRQKCVKHPDMSSVQAKNPDNYYNVWIHNSSNWQLDSNGDYRLCGNSSGAGSCNANYTCLADIGGNPNYGYTSFDHFGMALLTAFQLLTLDFWEDIYNKITRTCGQAHEIFFVAVVFLGSFYLLNLMLAVVAISYREEAAMAEKERLKKLAEKRNRRRDALYDLALLTINNTQTLRLVAKKRESGETVENRNSASKSSEEKKAVDSQITLSPRKSVAGTIPLGTLTLSAQQPRLSLTRRLSIRNESQDALASLSPGKRASLRSQPRVPSSICRESNLASELTPRMSYVLRNAASFKELSYDSRTLKRLSRVSYADIEPEWEQGSSIIVSMDDLEFESEDADGLLVDRNCRCCKHYEFRYYVSFLRFQQVLHRVVCNPVFDLVINIFIVVNAMFLAAEHHGQPPVLEYILKIVTDMRVFRIAKSWETMRILLEITINTIGALVNLTVVLCIIVYVFAIIGLDLFRDKYRGHDFGGSEGERWHFKDFFHSFLMVFRILCGEWVEPLWECMNVSDELCMVVFIPTLITGKLIVLNLFLALLLNAFSSENIRKQKTKLEAVLGTQPVEQIKQICCRCVVGRSFVQPTDESHSVIPKISVTDAAVSKTPSTTNSSVSKERYSFPGLDKRTTANKSSRLDIKNRSTILSNPSRVAWSPQLEYYSSEGDDDGDGKGSVDTKSSEERQRICKSDSFFGKRWWMFRQDLLWIVDNDWFENIVLLVVFANSSALVSALNILGGLTNATESFFFIALKCMRAFRPLRAISRWQSLRTVVSSLIHAIPDIFNVFLVVIVFWLVFSIMGVQFFAGKFYRCLDRTSFDIMNYTITPNKFTCISAGHVWENTKVNFDNAGAGFLALFQVATFEGWMEVMQSAVDATTVDEQPRFENNLYQGYIYFFEGATYLAAFLTPGQRKYYATLNEVGRRKPLKIIIRPKNHCMGRMYDIATSTRFELAIRLLIIFNMFYMALDHYNKPETMEEGLETINFIFTFFYGVEAFIKICGLRWHYFTDPWDIFDFSVLVASIIDIAVKDLLTGTFINPKLLRVVRIFRVGRILRIIKVMKGLKKLLYALIISLPAICNIGFLLFLIMYIYAIIGIVCFGDIKLTGALNELVNFRTFYRSIQLLTRLATSAGWNDILDPLLVSEPYCNSTYKTRLDGTKVRSAYGDCGIPWIAIPYMVSYIVIVYLVVINMYIAVILENYIQAHHQESAGITEDDFLMFYIHWEQFDPGATQYIGYEELSNFLHELEPPFRIEKPNKLRIAQFNLDIVEGDRIHCLDVLMALVHHVLGHEDEAEEVATMKAQMEAKFKEMFPTRVRMDVIATTGQRNKKDVAARVIQRAWRLYKMRKMLAEGAHPHSNLRRISRLLRMGHILGKKFSARSSGVLETDVHEIQPKRHTTTW
ncbi:hypothetical protein BaRGS_00016162 [Batillaria attramentaria]|uniref:Sodium channel protein n=1 Tax=Batillaria attramentaria TaxID=370345 RepID=A0ABD0KZK2_9CAEN